MFKLIKVDFYDEFACLMSECPDNCCDEDWDIYIDEETIRLYEKTGVPDLWSAITPTVPHKLIKHDHKCPFITPEGLCTFHRDYGEEYLSNTCRSYPRFVSSYGDIYLETLGLSCPATVLKVLEYEKPVNFPESVYYEEGDRIGTIPKMTEAEILAHSVISEFGPGKSVIDTYQTICRNCSDNEPISLCSKKDMLVILKEITASTPSERYVRELFDKEYADFLSDADRLSDNPGLYKIESKLNEIYPHFSCNVNRMLMFEHIMLDSQSERPDRKDVLVKGLIIWILLLMALECRIKQDKSADDTQLTECTYKLMRIMDHGGNALEMLKNRALSKK